MRDSGWTPFEDAEKSTITCFAASDVASLRLELHCDPRGRDVSAKILFERRCPAAHRQSMFDIVTFLNSKRVVSGFFAVDPRDGEVVYRQSQFVGGLEITGDFVDSFLNLALSTVRAHYDLIQKGFEGYSLQAARSQ
jgi:hypothetical protein